MLAERRRDMILDIVAEMGSVSVNELHRRLEVSRETVRRDITRLAADNKLRKTHGGALALDSEEPVFDERMSVNMDGKRAIGAAAAALVPDGATVTIDSGTTTLCLADALIPRRRLTVITNDIHVAGRLAGRNDNQVLLLGGNYVASEAATMGNDALAMLALYHPDVAFVGVSALTVEPWLMDYSREAAEMRGQMLALARTGVLLCDHTKFARTASYRVPNLDKVSALIVDKRPPKDLAAGLKKIDAEVVVA